mgnify:CR=1 FL=1
MARSGGVHGSLLDFQEGNGPGGPFSLKSKGGMNSKSGGGVFLSEPMQHLFPFILLALGMGVVAAGKPAPDLQARLDAFVQDRPGGIAVVWVDADSTAFFQAGRFSARDNRPITADTQFELGSVTKVFTALLLAESERLGKVGRDEPVATYLLPADDDDHPLLTKITLLTLATHTSGLPRLPSNFTRENWANPYVAIKRADLVEGLRLDGPRAVVGRSVAYSNFGVALLGEALAEAWRSGYDDALRAHVLNPLGMDATVIALPGTRPGETLAPGHDPAGRPAANWELDAYAPAGALRSSTRELGKFLRSAIGDEKAPLHAAFAATTTVQRAAPDVGGSIGLGWFVMADEKRPVFWHNGGTGGYRSFVGFTRADGGAAVAVLANHAVSVDEIGFALLGARPPTATVVTVKNAADYVGRYPLKPNFVIDVTTNGGALFAQATGQPRLGLRPGAATDRFEVAGVPAEVSFERDAQGKVIALVLHQNGTDQPATRVE